MATANRAAFAEELCSDAMRREISERLTRDEEWLEDRAEIHIGILCLYLFSARSRCLVRMFTDLIRATRDNCGSLALIRGFAHVIQSSCVETALAIMQVVARQFADMGFVWVVYF